MLNTSVLSDLKYVVVEWVKTSNILTIIYQDLTGPPFVDCTHFIARALYNSWSHICSLFVSEL